MKVDYLYLYCDGGFRFEQASWAYILVDDKDEVLREKFGLLDGDVNELRQIGGELTSIMRGIISAKELNRKVIIRHDLKGSYYWVQDFFSQNKAWKRNNKYTQQYRDFIQKNRDWILQYQWVKGHNNEKWNEYCDNLATVAFDALNKK